MFRKTLKGLLNDLPKKTKVKIGSGSSFFYCGKNDSDLPQTIEYISNKFKKQLANLIIKNTFEYEHLEDSFKAKIDKYDKKHPKASQEIRDREIARYKRKMERDGVRLPKQIMSLKTQYQQFTPLLERKVVYVIDSISPDEKGAKVIKIRGNEKGNYWTIKEYAAKKGE